MSRNIATAAVGAWLLALSLAFSQAADAKDPSASTPSPAWWVSGEALVWGVKSAPLPPTLTTFVPGSLSDTTGSGGDLGVSGTSVLSPSEMGYGMLPGGRFTLGHWLNSNQSVGLEGDGFFLVGANANFSASSGGSPSLRVPFNNVPPGAGFPLGSSSFVLADPNFAAGGQIIRSSLQLWGLEGNALFPTVEKGPFRLSFLAGVRYVNLREGLSIASTETLLDGSGAFTGSDSFATRNQFLGGQLGAKAQLQFDQFDGSLLAKMALGNNHQTVSINGSSSVTGFGEPAGSTITPGGIFAEGTNIGNESRNVFAYVPEAQVQVGYNFLDRIRVFIAYDFLYLSNAVRPGDQVDTTLNFTGNPTIGGAGSTLTGAARPQPQFKSSSFWAQGINIGLGYKF